MNKIETYSAKHFRKSDWIAFLLFLIAVLLLRYPSFYNTFLTEDEAFFILWTDWFTGKNFQWTDFMGVRFVTTLLLAFYQTVGGNNSVLFIHITGFFFAVLSAYFIYKIIWRIANRYSASVLSAILYLVLVSTPWYYLETNSELVINALITAGIYLWLNREDGRDKRFSPEIFLIGLLSGVALAEKFHGMIALPLFFLVFLMYGCRGRRLIIYTVNFFTGFSLLWGVIFLYLFFHDALAIYFQNIVAGNFFYIQDGFKSLFSDRYYLAPYVHKGFYSSYKNSDYILSLPKLLRNYCIPFLFSISSWVFLRKFYAGKESLPRLLLAYFFLALTVLPLSMKFYYHYFWLLAPPLCLMTGIIVSQLQNKFIRLLLTLMLFAYPILQTALMLCYVPDWSFRKIKNIWAQDDSRIRLRNELHFGQAYENMFKKLTSDLQLKGKNVLLLGHIPDLYIKADVTSIPPYLNLDIIKSVVDKKGKTFFTGKIQEVSPLLIFDVYGIAEEFLEKEFLFEEYQKIRIDNFICYVSKQKDIRNISVPYTYENP